MKSKVILLAVVLFSAVTVSAQMRWGVEAGVNISKGFDTSKTKAGFNVGAFGEYAFSKHWFMDASLKLSSQPCGDKHSWGNANDGQLRYTDDKDYTPYYLTLPVRFGYAFDVSSSARLSVAVGPMIGLGLFGSGKEARTPYGEATGANTVVNKNSEIFDSHRTAFFSSSRFEYGADARLALELKKHYVIGLDYSLIHIAGQHTAVDNLGIFSINLGYKF